MSIAIVLMILSGALLVFLGGAWIYLIRMNKPLPASIRQVFSKKYSKIIHPLSYLFVATSLFMAYITYNSWFYYSKIGINEPVFLAMGAVFTLTTVDSLLAVFLNRKFEKYAN